MKTQILNILKAHEGTFMSGAEISESLNVSRQAISKHIKKLKEQGYNIESVSRKGHRYIAGDEMYNASELMSDSKTRQLGKSLIFLDTVGSTNDYAKAIAFDANDMTAIVADEQTSGKGRLGRQWASEKESGIWTSIILKPNIEPADAAKITQIAAAAMTGAIESVTGLEIGIKWPNDLIVNKKKVCGILTEMSAELGGINYVIVGTGVNVNQTTFDEDIQSKATSLKLVTKESVSRKEILLAFFLNFENLYDDFIETSSLKKTIEICRSHSLLLNRKVRLITKASTREVFVKAIDDNGQLIVENELGKDENVFYGEVSVRGLYDYID